MVIESYPLTVYVGTGALDPEMGPTQTYKVTDCSLPRIGQDSTITTGRIFFGQDVIARVACLLLDYHGPAYERAHAQDAAALAR